MKWKTLMLSATLSSLLLSACGTGHNNANQTAMRNPDHNNLKNVTYNPNNYNGTNNYDGHHYNNTAGHNANYNVTHNPDGYGLNNTNRNYDHNANYNVTHNPDGYGLNNTNRNYDHNNVNRNVTNVNYNNHRMTVADKAAEKIVSLHEVDQANVIVTNRNAYVAAKLTKNTGDRLDKRVEKEISDIVKSTDRNIDHVYVSVNPDFYTRTTSFANDIRNGRPVEGFFDEFHTLVGRIFPTAR